MLGATLLFWELGVALGKGANGAAPLGEFVGPDVLVMFGTGVVALGAVDIGEIVKGTALGVRDPELAMGVADLRVDVKGATLSEAITAGPTLRDRIDSGA